LNFYAFVFTGSNKYVVKARLSKYGSFFSFVTIVIQGYVELEVLPRQRSKNTHS